MSDELIKEMGAELAGYHMGGSSYEITEPQDFLTAMIDYARKHDHAKLREAVYALPSIEHNYAGGKDEFIRVIDLSNAIDDYYGVK